MLPITSSAARGADRLGRSRARPARPGGGPQHPGQREQQGDADERRDAGAAERQLRWRDRRRGVAGSSAAGAEEAARTARRARTAPRTTAPSRTQAATGVAAPARAGEHVERAGREREQRAGRRAARTPQPSRTWLPIERSRVGAIGSAGAAVERAERRDDRLAEGAERAALVPAPRPAGGSPSPLPATSTAGMPAARSGPCAPAVSGSARRANWSASATSATCAPEAASQRRLDREPQLRRARRAAGRPRHDAGPRAGAPAASPITIAALEPGRQLRRRRADSPLAPPAVETSVSGCVRREVAEDVGDLEQRRGRPAERQSRAPGRRGRRSARSPGRCRRGVAITLSIGARAERSSATLRAHDPDALEAGVGEAARRRGGRDRAARARRRRASRATGRRRPRRQRGHRRGRGRRRRSAAPAARSTAPPARSAARTRPRSGRSRTAAASAR